MSIRDEIYLRFVEQIEPLFGIKPENMLENMRFEKDLHAKSVHYSQITRYLADIFKIEIPYMTFCRKATIGEAIDYVLKLYNEQREYAGINDDSVCGEINKNK